MPAIVVDALARTYRSRKGVLRQRTTEVEALRGISFEVGRGELFGLLGPNGAGKTTTIKILTTLLLPSSGSARVLGFDPAREAREVRRRIGYVFGGDRGLYDRLSALDNLRYFADLYRVPVGEKRRRIDELLELFGLEGRERERVETYSRGMRQRLHIARGLLHDPEVLFLDEPTIGLDPVGARELRNMIGGLRDAGKTILLTTHYMVEADELCGRIAVISAGAVVAYGTPADLKARVKDRSVVEIETFGIGDDEARPPPERPWCRIGVARDPRAVADRRRPVRQGRGARSVAAGRARWHDGGQGGRTGADARGRLRRARETGVIRALASGFLLHLKQFSRNAFDISGVLLWPILYASIAYYLLGAEARPELLLSASLGAAVMLMWSLVLIGSAGSLEQQRFQGTLELVVAAPMPLAAVIAPISLASGAVGSYGLLATLAWGRLAFGIPLSIEQPVAFVVAVPACVLAVGMLGLVTASTFVLYRAAFALGIAMQYPVWIATGLLVPLSVLPDWVGPVSWFLAPRWGFLAIQEAALGRTPWPDIGMCLVVSAAYFLIGATCLRAFEHVARSRATLRLT